MSWIWHTVVLVPHLQWDWSPRGRNGTTYAKIIIILCFSSRLDVDYKGCRVFCKDTPHILVSLYGFAGVRNICEKILEIAQCKQHHRHYLLFFEAHWVFLMYFLSTALCTVVMAMHGTTYWVMFLCIWWCTKQCVTQSLLVYRAMLSCQYNQATLARRQIHMGVLSYVVMPTQLGNVVMPTQSATLSHQHSPHGCIELCCHANTVVLSSIFLLCVSSWVCRNRLWILCWWLPDKNQQDHYGMLIAGSWGNLRQ